MKTIDSTADPACLNNNDGKPLQSEALVLGPDQAIVNALIYVESLSEQGSLLENGLAASEGAIIDQKGCRYVPHVVALQVGQKLRILNTDGILHNVHGLSQANPEFNEAMTKFTAAKEKIFDQAEIGLKMKCDIHPWMNSIVHVLPHRFFALTGEDGKYGISGLPAGSYKLTIWHEKLGEESLIVNITSGQNLQQDFKLQVPQ